MTRTVLVAAFTLLILSKINGQKMYSKDPGLLEGLEGGQGFVVHDAGESNNRALGNPDEKVIIQLW